MYYVTLNQIDQMLQEARFVGPFSNSEAAEDYADHENHKLQLRGIPSWVASFYVVDT